MLVFAQEEHCSRGRPCIPAKAHSVGLGIPNAICLRIKENGNFATAQLTPCLGVKGVAVMPNPGSSFGAQCKQCHGCAMEVLILQGDEC